MEDIYKLDELIVILEKIKLNGDGSLNFPKAFYSLAIEVKQLKDKINTKNVKPKI